MAMAAALDAVDADEGTKGMAVELVVEDHCRLSFLKEILRT